MHLFCFELPLRYFFINFCGPVNWFLVEIILREILNFCSWMFFVEERGVSDFAVIEVWLDIIASVFSERLCSNQYFGEAI